MLPHRVRTTLADAARYFSAGAAATPAARRGPRHGHFMEEAAETPLAGGGPSTAAAKNGSSGGDTLGRRLLSLVYAKRSAVIAIRKWKEEGRTVQKYQLNRIVRELRKHRRYKHALEVLPLSFVLQL